MREWRARALDVAATVTQWLTLAAILALSFAFWSWIVWTLVRLVRSHV